MQEVGMGEVNDGYKVDERKGTVWDTQDGGDVYDYDVTRRILSVFGFAICASASGLTVNRIVVSVLKREAGLSDIRFIYEVTTHTNTTPREETDVMRGDGVPLLAY